MYAESAGSRKTLGDVDVVYHEGIYHLFHLVLPNHDYIAHAVSSDCFNWRRVENAVFLGDPGSFDDSMLWTTHVTRDPHRPGWWRMFYTGLSRRELGLIQRIGMAVSQDLYRWEKAPVHWIDRRSALPYDLPGRPPQPPFSYDPQSCFPLVPDSQYYESKTDEGRHWVSWRDPFYYREGDRGWLLIAGRVKDGPIVRRGCVAVLEETSPDRFESRPPLHHPGLYDDIEVPNLVKAGGEYYLIGSIREDAKVRYWHSSKIGDAWRSFADNVLLPGGNYAGRVCEDDHGWLLFSFFTPGGVDRTNFNLMPPPKRLARRESGHLVVESFEGFESKELEELPVTRLCSMKESAGGNCAMLQENQIRLSNPSAIQIFRFDEDLSCFKLQLNLEMLSDGKCGLAFRVDRETHDGYYISLDLFKGVAQARSWGSGPEGSGEDMMQFRTMQSGYWRTQPKGRADFQLVAYGSYIELSVDGIVILSLADQTFRQGALGIYVESAQVIAREIRLVRLELPVQSDEHLTEG